jgi:hypothetical protein
MFIGRLSTWDGIMFYQVFLQDDMTLEEALRKSRKDGIQYGIAVSSTILQMMQRPNGG